VAGCPPPDPTGGTCGALEARASQRLARSSRRSAGERRALVRSRVRTKDERRGSPDRCPPCRTCAGRRAWALQYDQGERDGRLLRFLLTEETAWHRKAPFQGLTEELHLAAYLVAIAPQPGDVMLMWAAKRSNFDPSGGFDSRYLAVEGIVAAVELARGLDEPRDGSLLLVGVSRRPALSPPRGLPIGSSAPRRSPWGWSGVRHVCRASARCSVRSL